MKSDFKKMSVEQLWLLRDEITEVLQRKITEEMRELERRLALLRGDISAETGERRFHPRGRPKYRNPAQPAETWSGRGKRPKWFIAELRSGRTPEDLRYDQE